MDDQRFTVTMENRADSQVVVRRGVRLKERVEIGRGSFIVTISPDESEPTDGETVTAAIVALDKR